MPRRSRPHSAAKQGRSFRVAALNWVLSLRMEKMDPRVLVCAQRGRGHILQQNRAVLFVWLLKASGVPVCPRRPKPHSAAKQSCSFRAAALNSASPSINLEKHG